MKSIIITGSPGVGKTTQYRLLIEKHSYIPAPSHTTRGYREGEAPGVDMLSISVDEYLQNFNSGKYIEPDLDFAFYREGNAYYGTPIEYIDRINSGENLVIMATSILASEGIQEKCKGNISWIHLTANQMERERRMQIRDGQSFQSGRLNSGDSVGIIKHPLADITLNTGDKTPNEVLSEIIKIVKTYNRENKIPLR